MSSSSDEEDAVIFWYQYRQMKMKAQKRIWVHPYIERNFHCRLFVAAKELQESDTKFLAFYRMSKESYIALVATVAPAIQYKNTNMRECVSAEERILITLR
ncbi:hypothetical protein ABEB36_015348 [Hypothenemus hampei]|uniref:Uncharacterized protein n=1 Tax=Hypothenemus hampei TaxID=57062 RepID=A0ABD1E1Y8_HYPHA